MANKIQLRTAADFYAFLKRDFGSGTSEEYLEVELLKDIDMNDLSDDPYIPFNAMECCNGYEPFYIHFDGQNHTIKNLYINNISGYAYLFPFRNTKSEIKNLIFKDFFIIAQHVSIIGSSNSSGHGYAYNVHLFGSAFSFRDNYAFYIYYAEKCSYNGMKISFFNNDNYTFCNTRCIDCFMKVAADIHHDVHMFKGNEYVTNAVVYLKGCKNCRILASGRISYSIFIIEDAAGEVIMPKGKSVLYDKDVVDAKGLNVTGDATPETTAHLKDPVYMYEKYGFEYYLED